MSFDFFVSFSELFGEVFCLVFSLFLFVLSVLCVACILVGMVCLWGDAWFKEKRQAS